MAENKDKPTLVKIHNATCPVWLLGISFLKGIEPGCRLASKYDN
jgi:hypothetical protein